MASSEHELVVKVIPDMSEVDAEVARRQQPSVGRVVHYVSHGSPVGPDGTQAYTSQCRAAIMTAIDEYQSSDQDAPWIGHVSLCVLNPEGMFFNRACLQDEDQHKGGTWHWPERV